MYILSSNFCIVWLLYIYMYILSDLTHLDRNLTGLYYILPRRVCNMHCTLYTVHCTLYIVHCTLYILRLTTNQFIQFSASYQFYFLKCSSQR